MEILELALKLNKASKDYKIGNLQRIRTSIKGKRASTEKNIFNTAKIKNNADWAFHYGGRSELQFNIGKEKEGIRYGLAFSLESSRSFPGKSILNILYPKILKLNCLIREKPELFSDYKYWCHFHNERSQPANLVPLPPEIIKYKYFIFFGKLVKEQELDINTILQEFDKMLSIYILVEDQVDIELSIDQQETEQSYFNRQQIKLTLSREYTSVERETNIDIRHSVMQLKLKELLEKKYGSKNVSIENSLGKNRVDAVVKHKTGLDFYEVKIASNLRSCIRQALGQIIEYAYWPGKMKANNLIIVGEYPLNENGKRYLEFLNSNFSLPISYLHLTI